MKQRPKRTRQDKINDARIQRAIAGFQIPLTSIVRLNTHLEAMIASGVDDAGLRVAADFFLNEPRTGAGSLD